MIEVRVDYGIGTCIFLLRWFVTARRLGWSAFGWSEIWSLVAWIFFTALYVTLEFIGESSRTWFSARWLTNKYRARAVLYGAPVGMTEEMRLALTPLQRENAALGGMVMFGAFYTLICFLWALKGSLTFLFLNLTRDTPLHTYVKIVGWSIVASWVGAMLTHSLHCLPVQKNWQILPHPGSQSPFSIRVMMYQLLTVTVQRNAPWVSRLTLSSPPAMSCLT